MISRSDIIDNRKLFLKDAINDMLEGSDKIKFAVGYLYLSGFYQIADNLENLHEAKILIGSNMNRQLMEALAETTQPEELTEEYSKLKYQRQLEKDKIKDHLGEKITQNLQALPHTFQRQKEIQKLVSLVKNNKIKIKVYTKYPLHAKAYIFKYKDNIASASRSEGIAVVGSSNLTMSGFYHNTELNTYVRGQKNFEELNLWFNELWKEAVPFEETLKTIFENSWAVKTVNPYDIYILTLYHLIKSSIEKKSATIWNWDSMPDLFPFQKVAIMQAYEWLQKYNGVFICDVVGLGKTYIGAGLLKHLNKRVLIISPPGLIDMWKRFKERFGFDAEVISRGMLYRGIYDDKSALKKYERRNIVLIDESHHFRNSDTKMYRELQPFLIGKQVILMTATPQNTTPWNVYNHFIRQKRTFFLINLKNLIYETFLIK
jgi:HKD family nuclease